MNTDALAAALRELEAAATLTGEGTVQALDEALVRVTGLRDSSSIGPLLLLLSDRAEYEEGMFSLVHAAEAFDDDVYVRELLSVLPELVSIAPKWASIVLMRVLNDDAARTAMVTALREAPPPAKQSTQWLCERINERSPSFANKTLAVLLATGK